MILSRMASITEVFPLLVCRCFGAFPFLIHDDNDSRITLIGDSNRRVYPWYFRENSPARKREIIHNIATLNHPRPNTAAPVDRETVRGKVVSTVCTLSPSVQAPRTPYKDTRHTWAVKAYSRTILQNIHEVQSPREPSSRARLGSWSTLQSTKWQSSHEHLSLIHI